MKKSVLALGALMTLFLSSHAAYAEDLRVVLGQGEWTGFYQTDDELSMHHTKNEAKLYADEQASDECDALNGQPVRELASYNSTCQIIAPPNKPTMGALGAYKWHKCTVWVEMECRLQ